MMKIYTPLLLLTSLVLLSACDNQDKKSSESASSESPTVIILEKATGDAFIVSEANARYSLGNDDQRVVVLKKGLEVDVTGVTSDKKYYEVKSKSIKEKLYVSSENIALIGK